MPSRFRPRAALCTLLAFSAFIRPAAAQAVLGPGDDGWHLPRGAMRISLSSRFGSADDEFNAAGTRASLGAPFSGALTSASLPTLAWLEGAVQNLSGAANFSLSLGRARADLRRATARVPLEVSMGVTSRVMLFAAATFHAGEHEVNWLLDPDGATVGANPALLATGAAAQNSAIVSGLDTAAALLERLADGCALDVSSDPRCAQVVAEMTQVRSLISSARGATNGVALTYGGRDGVTPSAFVPLSDGDAHLGTLARLESLRLGFSRYGTASIGEGAGPAGASAPVTPGDLRTLLESEAYGYHTNPLTRRYQQGFGDTDVGVSLLLFDGIRDTTSWGRFGAAQFGIRQSVAFVYRAGTGTPAHVDDPLLIPTGDGQDDLEIASATDVLFNRRAWASIVVRYTMQQPRDALARIPDGSGSPFLTVDRRRMARHELGNRLELAVSPRWVLNERLAIGAGWRWLVQDAEQFDELAPFTDAIPLSHTGTERSAHEVGVGFTWSSVAAWQRGESRFPLEIQWDRRLVIAGEGVPRVSSDRIAVRAYHRLWGR